MFYFGICSKGSGFQLQVWEESYCRVQKDAVSILWQRPLARNKVQTGPLSKSFSGQLLRCYSLETPVHCHHAVPIQCWALKWRSLYRFVPNRLSPGPRSPVKTCHLLAPSPPLESRLMLSKHQVHRWHTHTLDSTQQKKALLLFLISARLFCFFFFF